MCAGTWLGPAEWFSDVEGSDPLASCGRPLPYTDVEIREEDNSPLPVLRFKERAPRRRAFNDVAERFGGDQASIYYYYAGKHEIFAPTWAPR
jgi:hypothetical protein